MLTYTISELAEEFAITPRAIRYYEDQGLLRPTREGAGGQRRVYSARERTRLKLTLRGRRLGLSLAQIKALIDLYESPGDSLSQTRQFLDVLASHRATLLQQREDIDAMLAEIATHEKACRLLLEGADSRPRASAKSAAKSGAAKMPVRTRQAL